MTPWKQTLQMHCTFILKTKIRVMVILSFHVVIIMTDWKQHIRNIHPTFIILVYSVTVNKDAGTPYLYAVTGRTAQIHNVCHFTYWLMSLLTSGADDTDLWVISGFRRESDVNSALLDYYAASCCNSLPTFRENLSVPSSGPRSQEKRILTPEEGTDMLSRNVCKKLPILVA
jgi:hypothetical protein